MILDKFSLKGKSGIVTGASRGIGKGIAEALAQAGANLAIAARGISALEKAAEELRRYGTDVIAVRADVSLKADVENLVAKTLERFGRIDFLGGRTWPKHITST
ncbi:MAG TPA: SDR family NAD(P)-dependent oxidoreductase [Candidatus Latescibacteria bacterium]|nr:SDR family NAD(P)-dependent oxidoreductase [Candidatus Latescibacterota bacterium]